MKGIFNPQNGNSYQLVTNSKEDRVKREVIQYSKTAALDAVRRLDDQRRKKRSPVVKHMIRLAMIGLMAKMN